MKELTAILRQACPETFHNSNTAQVVKYPYVTYELSREYLEPDTDGFYIDLDLFDLNSSYVKLVNLSDELMDLLRKKRLMTDKLFIRFEFEGSNPVDTTDDSIKRLNMRFYAKVDWRDKTW